MRGQYGLSVKRIEQTLGTPLEHVQGVSIQRHRLARCQRPYNRLPQRFVIIATRARPHHRRRPARIIQMPRKIS